MLVEALSSATSYLPHVEVPVPFRLAPRRQLKVYLDSELGLPLNFREPNVQKLLLTRLDSYATVLDVGAHIGTYSILSTVSKETTVHAFEPHPTNVLRIQENARFNRVADRVSVEPSAVWDSNEEVELIVGRTTATHRAQSPGESVDVPDRSRVTVSGITIDSYCGEANVKPDLIKVDVEGVGEKVVSGTSRTLEHEPDWLVEIHTSNEDRAFSEVFEKHGYVVDRISDRHWFATTE